MATHVYEAVVGGNAYRLATRVDLGDNAFMGFLKTTDGWQPTTLARAKPSHSTAMTFLPAVRLQPMRD